MQFAKALIAGKSNKDAAIAAGYSEKTAAQSGSRLAKDPEVKKYVAKLRREAKAMKAEDGDSPELAKAKAAVKKATTAAKVAVDAVRNAGVKDIDDLPKIFTEPADFLLAVMNDQETEQRLRVQSAGMLLNDKAKRDLAPSKKKPDADKPAESKFGRRAPPRLAASGGSAV